MRKKITLGGIIVFLLCLFTTSAGAVSINLLPGPVIGANSTEFSVTIGIDTGADSIGGYGISIAYDTSELEFLSATELLPTGFDFNVNAGVAPGDSTGSSYPFNLIPPDAEHAGVVGSFEAANLFSPAVSGAFDIGIVNFRIIGQGTVDGNDILAGLFNVGVDDILDSNSIAINPALITFGSMDVNAIPEPASMLLLGTGLLGLVAIGRKK